MRVCLSRTASRKLALSIHDDLTPSSWDVITPHFGRITQLHIYAPKKPVPQMHQLIGTSMPSLEYLNFRSLVRIEEIASLTMQGKLTPWKSRDLPRLRRLALSPAALFPLCVVETLTKLDLFNYVQLDKFGSFVQAFQRCPMLHTLHMNEFHFDRDCTFPTLSGDSARINLPLLRKLEITYPFETQSYIISLLRLFKVRLRYFELEGVHRDRFTPHGWRKSLPGIYPIEHLDTISLYSYVCSGQLSGPPSCTMALRGWSGGLVYFSEELKGKLRHGLADIKSLFSELPQSVHTLYIEGTGLLPHGRSRKHWKYMVDAVPGLRTLKISSDVEVDAKRNLIEALFERGARIAADESGSENSPLELIWVLEEPFDFIPWPDCDEYEDEDEDPLNPLTAAQVEADLAVLEDTMSACSSRQTFPLSLGLHVRPRTQLFDAVWQRHEEDSKGQGWEDVAMEIPVVRRLARMVDNLCLIFGDTRLQLSKPVSS